jgi:hypothetical protein
LDAANEHALGAVSRVVPCVVYVPRHKERGDAAVYRVVDE